MCLKIEAKVKTWIIPLAGYFYLLNLLGQKMLLQQ